MANRAVFVDRDGTLIEDPGYLSDPAGVRLLPGAAEAIASLKQAGYKIVVVTNQSGVARGLFTERTLEEIHMELRRLLAEQNAALDGIYYCPHHPEGIVRGYIRESEERKPSPGMLLRAARELDIDLSASWMVGDSEADVEAGRRAGCRTIRLRESVAAPARRDAAGERTKADFTAADLRQAARTILGDRK